MFPGTFVRSGTFPVTFPGTLVGEPFRTRPEDFTFPKVENVKSSGLIQKGSPTKVLGKVLSN